MRCPHGTSTEHCPECDYQRLVESLRKRKKTPKPKVSHEMQTKVESKPNLHIRCHHGLIPDHCDYCTRRRIERTISVPMAWPDKETGQLRFGRRDVTKVTYVQPRLMKVKEGWEDVR